MDKIEILFKEYEAISQEINIEKQRYNQQTNFANMYLTVILGITGGLLINKDLRSLLANPPANVGPLFFVASLAGAIMGFYLVASTMDALFAVYLLGTRKAAIEKLINAEKGKDLLIWESKIWPHFYFEFNEVKARNKPQYFVGLWVVLLLIVTNAMLTILCWLFTKNNILSLCYAVFVSIATLLCIHQWLDLNTIVMQRIIEKIKEQSGLPKGCELRPCFWKVPGLIRRKQKE